ncbi:hypothetical protein BEH70_23840 [Citrobacter freundii]|uniref:hypothetical protein n=1 Tax=Citrobacter TaxID=544 RepID=UPI00081A3D52|nr:MULTISPECIES: hypothetical protein [Citrobacter]ANZ87746.1 hypothetical protein CfB38_2830 [Citrobacter freundii]ANZ87818.1 hypothetical protein CfB38_2903 [Citrobacter freundii]EGT0624348.1 hypothetical protein [Citrobacter freundii]ELK7473497.1 hypothetical protein [Citrobacter freundii]MDM3189114.1 hypothetical protein [Citrobacter sp. Cf101]
MEFSITLKVAGAVLTTLGSILLAWRAFQISKLVKSVLDAHEVSLVAIAEVFERGINTTPFLTNMGKHHDEYEKGIGFKLVVLGFSCLALGAISNASSYFV